MGGAEKLLNDYIPKDETQQNEFIKKYPEYDGRGIVIAIIDTGIDVSLPGMQYTSTGLPKVLECFDFGSSIEIDVSNIRESSKAGNTVISLSGRKLKENNDKENNNNFDKTTAEKSRLKKFENDMDKLRSENAMVDCVVWFDGEKWRGCIDFSFSKDLENAKTLTNFRDNHEYGLIFDKISYSIEICKNGSMLKICINFPSEVHHHGTIVAHIAAANFPNEPSRNGLAPGAQMISMDIFKDKSLNSLKNALLKCIELEVDIINLSIDIYSESNISKTLKEISEKYGIIVFNSVGNDGPFYSSLFEDYANFNDYIFTVGAMSTKETYKKIFDVEKEVDENVPRVFQFSSRGPLKTGERGIDFVAPGAAITPVPKWVSENSEISYGTSMSCPNAAGAMACLLSALKANSIEYNPSMLKLALSNTAFLPENVGSKLSFGAGIIQINAAFEFIKTFKDILTTKIPPKISLYESTKKTILMKAIYFIQNENDAISRKFCVNINSTKNTLWNLKLFPKTAESFIDYSKTVTKNNMFFVKTFTTSLKPGSLNYAEIHGYDSSLNPSFGPLFYLSITVIVPQRMTKNSCIVKELIWKPQGGDSIFLCPPTNCEKCFIKFTVLQEAVMAEIFVKNNIPHNSIKVSNQSSPQQEQSDTQILKFNPSEKSQCCNFSVHGQKMFELTFYLDIRKEKNLKNLKSLKFKLEIDFDLKESDNSTTSAV